MKTSSLKILLSMAAAAGLCASADADLVYTFDSGSSGTDGGGFNGGSFGWDPSYHAIQQTTTVGGWTLGGAGPKFEWAWPCQTVMQAYANTGQGRISFDLFVSADWTFNYGPWNDGDWYQLHWAGNSDGAHGWTQDVINEVPIGNPVNTNYHSSDPDLTWHFDVSFADLGFDPGDTWFQLFFGSNSAAENAVQFYIDNIHVYIPEPGTLALAALGTVALLIFRRR